MLAAPPTPISKRLSRSSTRRRIAGASSSGLFRSWAPAAKGRPIATATTKEILLVMANILVRVCSREGGRTLAGGPVLERRRQIEAERRREHDVVDKLRLGVGLDGVDGIGG